MKKLYFAIVLICLPITVFAELQNVEAKEAEKFLGKYSPFSSDDHENPVKCPAEFEIIKEGEVVTLTPSDIFGFKSLTFSEINEPPKEDSVMGGYMKKNTITSLQISVESGALILDKVVTQILYEALMEHIIRSDMYHATFTLDVKLGIMTVHTRFGKFLPDDTVLIDRDSTFECLYQKI